VTDQHKWVKMHISKLTVVLLVVIVDTKAGDILDKIGDDSLGNDEGTGRLMLWRFLPQYQDVDIGANFNKLKSSGDTAFFVVRDTIVYLGVQLMWIVIHSLLWNGEVSNYQDIGLSLLSPGVDVPLSSSSDSSDSPSSKISTGSESSDLQESDSRFTFDSLSELSFTKIWNYFTDPNPSTRNLYLNIGFALGSHLLWILPTFLGTRLEERSHQRVEYDPSELHSLGTILDDDNKAAERLGGLPANILSASLVDLWNRLLSPQGVAQNIAVNVLNLLGKLLFWTFMSSVPDLPAESVIGRK